MYPDLFGADASPGQFRMQQFERFDVHLIAQHRDTIEQFRRSHCSNAGQASICSNRYSHGLPGSFVDGQE